MEKYFNSLIKNQNIREKTGKIAVFLVFFTFFVVGICVFRDYGVSIDEYSQRKIGLANYLMLFEQQPVLDTLTDRDYGPAFELPLIILEKALGLTQTQEIIYLRHLVTHLLFGVSLWFFYSLLYHIFSKRYLALLGTVFLMNTPHIYAHSFFNSKDIPFMSVFIICLWAWERALTEPKIKRFVILGVLCGLLINLRIVGLMMMVLPLPLLLAKYSGKWHAGGKVILFWQGSAWGTLYLTWPYLWPNPFGNFVQALQNMAHFRWLRDNLLWGQFYPSDALPWFYLPSWFMLTTPVLYLLLGIAGMVYLVKDKWVRLKAGEDFSTICDLPLLAMLFFWTPILMVIALKSVLYDGWRHMYFIYPPFLVMVVFALDHIFMRSPKFPRPIQLMLPISIFFSLSLTFIFLFQAHPFQQVYFNLLVPKQEEYLRRHFERDYWGPSFRQALEYILSQDSSERISVALNHRVGQENALILSPEQRERFDFTMDVSQADYFVSNYRWHPEDYSELGKPEASIIVQQNTVISIWRLKDF
ncbi:MAG: glycosyltransferase family 39 protein [Candidatus Sericytochromatia bacterium]